MTLGIRPPRRPTRIKLVVEPAERGDARRWRIVDVEPYDIGVLAPLRRAPAPAAATPAVETPRVRVNAEPLVPRDE